MGQNQENNRDNELNQSQSGAYEKLFDSYFAEIKQRYMVSDNLTRLFLIGRLEEITKGVVQIPSLFNGKKAKQIRLNKDLTLRGLVKEVQMPLGSLVNYEKGVYSPRVGSRGKGSRKYLEWLKEQGYNPFDI